MYLLDKKTKRRERPLANEYKNILISSEEYNELEKRNFTEFLNKIKDNYWIECDCVADDAILVIYSSKYNISVRCKERNYYI